MSLLAILAVALAAVAAGVDETEFRYTRALTAPAGAPVRFEPDGPLYGHARIDFPDLRVLDSRGEQVPWRPEPLPAAVPSRPVELVARGTRNGVVSVVADLGPAAEIVDRMTLDIPDRVFVGEVAVQGSSTGAEGTYARLSTTPIYSVQGAVDARSTTAVFPATDYRYLLVQASGVSQIDGASVARDPSQAVLLPVEASSRTRERGRATVVRLDLGYANVPVDAVQIRSSTPRYVRQLTVEGSNDGASFTFLGSGEIARFQGVDLSQLEVAGRQRFLRVTIRNGDDAPLEALRVTAQARARPLLLSEGFRGPYRLLYGADAIPAPDYDFAQLPASATGYERAVAGRLGTERANEAFEAPPIRAPCSSATTNSSTGHSCWPLSPSRQRGCWRSGDAAEPLAGGFALRAAEEAARPRALRGGRRLVVVLLARAVLRRKDPDRGVRHSRRERDDAR